MGTRIRLNRARRDVTPLRRRFCVTGIVIKRIEQVFHAAYCVQQKSLLGGNY